MRFHRGLVLVVMLSAVGSCKKDELSVSVDAAELRESKPDTVTRYVGDFTYLLKEQNGDFVLASSPGKPLELLSALEVELPADAGRQVRVYDGGLLRGWVLREKLLEVKPARDESMKAVFSALGTGQPDLAKHHAWLAWAANRKDFSPLFLASAIELAHGQPLTLELEEALKGVARPKEPPRFEALWLDAGEPAPGNTVYVAAADVGLRPKAEAKAALTVPLELNAALDITQVQGDWLEVVQHVAWVDAGVADADAGAGVDDDGGVAAVPAPARAAAPAPAKGYIETAAVALQPVTKESLLAIGTPPALELAALVDPSDATLLARALEADFAAGRFAAAVSLSEHKPDTGYLKGITLELLFGCRGKKVKAEVFDAEKLPAKVPPNACIGPLSFPACVECFLPSSSRNESRRKERETDRREKLRKRFPDGQFVRAELPEGGPSSQLGFFYELPYAFEQHRCDEYTFKADAQNIVLSEPIKLPRTGEPARVEWHQVANDAALYGFIVARSPDEALRYAASVAARTDADATKLAPEPNVTGDTDTCPDCSSCGD